MRRIGINHGCVKGISDEEFVEMISSLGFESTFSGVMADVEKQSRFSNLLAKKNIAYDTLHAPFSHINDIWLSGEKGDRMLGELKETIDRCSLVGAKVAIIHLSSGETPPPMSDIGRDRFLSLVEYAKEKGIKPAFENQRKLANLAWMMEEFAGDDGIGFCWDAGHEGCFTPGKQFMPLFGDRLCALHLHDNRGIYNADDHMLPLDGNLDFSRVARQIKESGYLGTMMLEVFRESSDFYSSYTPLAYLTRAAEAARELVRRTDEK